MNKENQIEEMAKTLDEMCDLDLLADCEEKDCSKCMATALYNAGYRKQSEDVPDTNVGCKFCEDDYSLDNLVCYIPADDGASIDPPVRYCPFCGAKMKGGE